ncbi:hypothetical protein JTB14_001109 [Gonioctena quinquepunctata]|nr:hypothetical protein JTB14_001109 [Gonioctena quinquepunctata]
MEQFVYPYETANRILPPGKSHTKNRARKITKLPILQLEKESTEHPLYTYLALYIKNGKGRAQIIPIKNITQYDPVNRKAVYEIPKIICGEEFTVFEHFTGMRYIVQKHFFNIMPLIKVKVFS